MNKRYLGLDLGTKTLGVSITDRSNTIIFPHVTIRFKKEDYDDAINQVKTIIEKENITDIAIGLPKNMDGSLGFASQRTLNFIPKLEKLGVNVFTVDERLTSVEAERILHENNLKSKEFKDKVDMEAAVLILESYLRSIS
jgi:putative Holliday junction resolvase